MAIGAATGMEGRRHHTTPLSAADYPTVAVLRDRRERGYDGLIELEHEPLDPSEGGKRTLLGRLHVLEARP